VAGDGGCRAHEDGKRPGVRGRRERQTPGWCIVIPNSRFAEPSHRSAKGRLRPVTHKPSRWQLSSSFALKQPVRSREEFRTPLGVRKSPKNEPAGRWRSVWGFRVWATPERLGSGAGLRTLAERVGASEGLTSRRLDLVGAYWGHCLRAPVLGAQAASMTAAGLRLAGRSCRAGSRHHPPG